MFDWQLLLTALATGAAVVAAGVAIYQSRTVKRNVKLVDNQLEQIRIDKTHRRFDALQWAMSLLLREEVDRMYSLVLNFERTEAEQHEISDLEMRLRASLELIALAIEEGYLDQELFFKARAHTLNMLNLDMLMNMENHPGRFASRVLRLTWWASGSEAGPLITKASEWSQRKMRETTAKIYGFKNTED